ncbi:hypothetical protein FA13DRAFT_1799028 [Coprinellus micaceus]|uniref:Ribonuclease H1 N-terminal domain-containing protein n=1 Tax=Coprinellus micaceus TaxID=71717 RepID=A0A4Y7SEW8_COPMI|nr:hypothetical protein FA13DRAFT_1802067 [Coprinellus micaceus]TEB22264.1 hypothetical protein FA13DRAFT_1799028 [Coprinellus micaceus]
MTNLLGRHRNRGSLSRPSTPVTPVYGSTDHISNLAEHLNSISFGVSRIPDQAPQEIHNVHSAPSTPRCPAASRPSLQPPLARLQQVPLPPVSPFVASRPSFSLIADAVAPFERRATGVQARMPTVVVPDSDSDSDAYESPDLTSNSESTAQPLHEQENDNGVPGQGPVSTWRVWPGSRRINNGRRFYVVSVGRVCGVFNVRWLLVSPLCKGYKKAVWEGFDTIADAWDHYTTAYQNGDVQVIHHTFGDRAEEERFGPYADAIQVPRV